MKKIIDNIILEYEKEAENFIEELIKQLLKERGRIYEFFGLVPSSEIKIAIVPTKSELDKIFKQALNYNPHSSVVGFTPCEKDNFQMYLLSYNDYKNTMHAHETLENYKKTFMHEFAHIINAIYSNGKFPITPIWEGAATYLSNQYDDETNELKASKEELLEGQCDYRNYYALFLKILENYSHEEVLRILDTTIDGEIVINETLKIQKSTM